MDRADTNDGTAGQARRQEGTRAAPNQANSQRVAAAALTIIARKLKGLFFGFYPNSFDPYSLPAPRKQLGSLGFGGWRSVLGAPRLAGMRNPSFYSSQLRFKGCSTPLPYLTQPPTLTTSFSIPPNSHYLHPPVPLNSCSDPPPPNQKVCSHIYSAHFLIPLAHRHPNHNSNTHPSPLRLASCHPIKRFNPLAHCSSC